ncbi:hypothetical protein LZZ85_07080 [Terrimonas sp. NA20]|uniref:PE-PGRS family protein n=1 Tax=Terrimonas ginsenosidimutans TaxID=2908004 RepID=A0ABS9KNY2_9BACT|nr:hypothetical protein [Terrimonas ginsenosidimutans]MCG2614037.1 hypothetical protein [Terrimonas ginsenosidimutans]
MRYLSLYIFVLCLSTACSKKEVGNTRVFDETPVEHLVKPGEVDEVSGAADSKTNPGYLWLHEDSGNPTQLSLMSHSGELKKHVTLKGIRNRDWEELALAKGPEPEVNYIYLADIGNNNLSVQHFVIYRFPEPTSTDDEVTKFEKIAFTYPDKTHDAEAMFIDNVSKDIFILSKEDSSSAIYRIPYPQSTTSFNKAEFVGRLPYGKVVGAAMSPTNSEVLIKTYSAVYYWKLTTNAVANEILNSPPLRISYVKEPQGEAIVFRNDNSGFFTISERPPFIKEVKLYFYKRR